MATVSKGAEAQLAEKIPAEYRREILDLDMIARAQATNTDETMVYLGTIWKNYIDPYFDPHCNLCYERVLKNFKRMVHALQELEKGDQLLDKL